MPKASFENRDFRSSSPSLGRIGNATANTGVHAQRAAGLANEERIRDDQSHDNPSQKTFSPDNGRQAQSSLLKEVPAKEKEIVESESGRINIQQDQPDNPVF